MILEKDGLSIELLEKLSYRTSSGISLKKNLHYFDQDILLKDIRNYAEILDENEELVSVKMDYRIKSMHSVKLKYERYYPDAQARKVFNDILGFRGLCDNYEEVLVLNGIDNIRIADMSLGKANDDGYRGVHVYYQIDNAHYPIEIQYNTYYDRQLNNWLHKYLYKRSTELSYVGKILREKYELGKIKTEAEFKERLENVLYNSKEI